MNLFIGISLNQSEDKKIKYNSQINELKQKERILKI